MFCKDSGIILEAFDLRGFNRANISLSTVKTNLGKVTTTCSLRLTLDVECFFVLQCQFVLVNKRDNHENNQ